MICLIQLKFDADSEYDKKLNNLPKSLEQIYIPEELKNNIENLNPNCAIIFVGNELDFFD
jgi:hypothetical protein